MTNIDVARAYAKNYYGAPKAVAGTERDGNMVDAAEPGQQLRERGALGREGRRELARRRARRSRTGRSCSTSTTRRSQRGTTSCTSNWDFNPTHERQLRRPDASGRQTMFTGNMFPATPGMVDLVTAASPWGTPIFLITGRGDSQHAATIANLVNDAAAGDSVEYPNIDTVTLSGHTIPEVDADYPMPTPIDTGRPRRLHRRPVHQAGRSAQYPAYLNKPEFCAAAIARRPRARRSHTSRAPARTSSRWATTSSPTSATSSAISIGGFADKTFKMPNPNYYLP